ncbi:LrgB family protein [Thalassomonas actiniarum]|uniref:LrgB family protein n=1 Tax=Thalassomonas actiniarum TaxID=485447 RepID=A0AAE9YSI5_9GAMM|nr:LrgB family protein [Thalassomonas actiniarum]WDE00431.1 LrgB family protein [Thalassomonas actiniarum]
MSFPASTADIFTSVLLILATITLYQGFAWLQRRSRQVWLNPMLLSILVIIPCLLLTEMPFQQFYRATEPLNMLLEPAVVALGFPLYQQLSQIARQWKVIFSLLILGALLVISISFCLTMLLLNYPQIAVSLSLKSITTPIGLALTSELQGDTSVTAFAIILAGLFGALLGPAWLKAINVHSPKAQGLAIGAASHALGTATISKTSYEHGAYGSLALIISAIVTALISPGLIGYLQVFFTGFVGT